MSNILALVLAGGQVEELLCLTEKRAKSALPVFGMYRIIDFVLSNLMHAGIENVGILSQYRPHDLVRHIGSGEHWDFIGRRREIQILPPYRGLHGSDWYKGTADAVYQNIAYIEEYDADHIIIASADHVYRMDYRSLMQFHIEHRADATICFTPQDIGSTRFGYGIIENDRLIDYIEKPSSPLSTMVSMTLYVFRKNFLLDVLQENARAPSHEFGKDILPRMIKHDMICAYAFGGYWAYARTIDSYYRTNMDVLKGKIDLGNWQIRTNLTERTKKKDRVPAFINGDVENSIISDGCMIKGTVKNSILSPGVCVARGAEIVDSILFHDTTVGENSQLKRVICDKDTAIADNVSIGLEGEHTPSSEFKELLKSGISIIGRTVTISENTVIGANTVVYPGSRIDRSYVPAGSTLR
ncbi:glucose-1-phosphate adenylyltransferase [candidate division WOR-3 bacterium]|nr:glucose-1-phosphate adenylyltransferase [candidate division WOR-3 bacterium]